jgi:hypothetical protein
VSPDVGHTEQGCPSYLVPKSERLWEAEEASPSLFPHFTDGQTEARLSLNWFSLKLQSPKSQEEGQEAGQGPRAGVHLIPTPRTASSGWPWEVGSLTVVVSASEEPAALASAQRRQVTSGVTLGWSPNSVSLLRRQGQ